MYVYMRVYRHTHMSVRQCSGCNPVPWTEWRGPIAFAGFGASENQGIALRGSATIVTL